MAETTGATQELTRSGGSPSRHVSLSNPLDDGAADLPRLLRRVADLIEAEGITAMEILDVVVHQEMTADGPWWSVTVHWSPDDPQDMDRSQVETAHLLRSPANAERLRSSIAAARAGRIEHHDLIDPDASGDGPA